MAPRQLLQRVFGPIARDWWLYPTLVAAGTLQPAALGIYEWILFANTFAVMCGLAIFGGIPMNLTFRHLWAPVVGPVRGFSLRALLVQLAIIGFWLVVGMAITRFVLTRLGSRYPFEEAGPQIVLTGLLLCFVFITMAGAIDDWRKRVHALELRELRARQESTVAQLQAIQARIQPHFLFNCLNTVAGLIQESPAQAEEAVERLADLFRYTLQASKRRAVALEEEVEAVRGFLALEGLRYGERVKAALHVAPGLGAVPVPPLVLQPMVENAVLHGIAPRRAGGRLEVRVERDEEGDGIVLTVDDDGPGPGASAHTGSRTALADLRRRLALLYGERARVEEGRGALGGYQIRIVLPADGPDRFWAEEGA